MKKAILMLLVALPFMSKAQIEVYDSAATASTTIGKVKSGTATKAQLTSYVDDDDTTYSLLYQNAKYEHITDFQSIQFSGGSGVLDQFYSIIKTFFSEENKKNKEYKKQFKLGEGDITILNFRMMGVTNAMIFTDKGHFFLTDKQTDKLFGRTD